jgi:hypothetical protein
MIPNLPTRTAPAISVVDIPDIAPAEGLRDSTNPRRYGSSGRRHGLRLGIFGRLRPGIPGRSGDRHLRRSRLDDQGKRVIFIEEKLDAARCKRNSRRCVRRTGH